MCLSLNGSLNDAGSSMMNVREEAGSCAATSASRAAPSVTLIEIAGRPAMEASACFRVRQAGGGSGKQNDAFSKLQLRVAVGKPAAA